MKNSHLEVRSGSSCFAAFSVISADFALVSDLKKGASIEIAWVEVGRVEKIMLDPKQVGRA